MVTVREADHSSCIVLVTLGDFDEKTIVDPVETLLMVWGAPKKINNPNIVLSDEKFMKLLWCIGATAPFKTNVLRES
jgi:hypothetical protein